MKVSRLILTAALVLPLFPHIAQAASGEWTTVASACMPDENAIASYSNDSAASFIATGITGDIVLRCNVTNPADIGDPDWNVMDVTYNDQDGPGIDKAVWVSLRRVHESTGVSSTIASFNSNGHALGQQRESEFYTHVFDFENYAYYLQITLRRVSLDADGNGVGDPSPRIQRVRLYTLIPG
jgi:hypothetical protein